MDTPVDKKQYLGFHQIGTTFDWTLNVFPPDQLLKILNSLSVRKQLPSLVFDDGYANVAGFYDENLPLFNCFDRYISIISGSIGQSNQWDVRPGGGKFRHLKREDIRRLHVNGWQVLSHGLTHRSLVTISGERLLEELRASKKTLEDITGHEVTGLSFPFGFYSKRVVDTAFECGYRQFFSIRRGNEEKIPVHRVYAVYRWDRLPAISRKLTGNPLEQMKLRFINNCAAGTVLLQTLADSFKK